MAEAGISVSVQFACLARWVPVPSAPLLRACARLQLQQPHPPAPPAPSLQDHGARGIRGHAAGCARQAGRGARRWRRPAGPVFQPADRQGGAPRPHHHAGWVGGWVGAALSRLASVRGRCCGRSLQMLHPPPLLLAWHPSPALPAPARRALRLLLRAPAHAAHFAHFQPGIPSFYCCTAARRALRLLL